MARQEQVVLAVLLTLLLLGVGLVIWQRYALQPVLAPEVDAAVYARRTSTEAERGQEPALEPGGEDRRTAERSETRSPPAGAGPGEGVSPATVVVHVAGAVRAPGVYTLREGQRVADALAAAGGAAAGARPDLINLAERLQDGQKVYIPSEKDARTWTAETPPGGPPRPRGAAAVLSGANRGADKVDINSAGPEVLEALPGIGPALAARIIKYRQTHGPFRRIEDIQEVPGIGPSKFQEMRERLAVH